LREICQDQKQTKTNKLLVFYGEFKLSYHLDKLNFRQLELEFSWFSGFEIKKKKVPTKKPEAIPTSWSSIFSTGLLF